MRVEQSARTALVEHEWPGNAREVVNLARRVALFAEDGLIDESLVRRMLAANPFGGSSTYGPPQSQRDPVEEVSLETVERRHIARLMTRHRNVTRVARILEINRRTLQRKLKAWDLDVNDL